MIESKVRRFLTLNLFLLLAALLPSSAYTESVKAPKVTPAIVITEPPPIPLQSFGWMEEAILVPGEMKVLAKLDTGADTSSIHAEDIKFFERDEKPWVRFEVSNNRGDSMTFEREVRRQAQIKRKRGSPQERPVVRLGVCVGNLHEVVEFSLVDRSNFSSGALIGRNFLSGKIQVDSARSHTVEPECKDFSPR